MKAQSLVTVSLALFAVACSDSVLSPERHLRPRTRLQDQIANETTPSAVTVTNPCNGDVVVLAGRTHTVVDVTQSNSGNYSSTVDISSTYDGSGAPSGLTYQGSDVIHDEFSVQNPLPYEETILQEFHLRSQTGADNFLMRLQFHFTVNNQGVLTADVSNPTTSCEG